MGANNVQLVGPIDFEAWRSFEVGIAVTIHEIDLPAKHANGREWLLCDFSCGSAMRLIKRSGNAERIDR